MEININQQKIAIGNKYKVFIDGSEKYKASTKLFTFFAEINLQELHTETVKISMKRKWDWFKYSYDITDVRQQVYEFRTISLWKRHYVCMVGADKYEVFGHKGRKHSIYKNNEMIAYYEIGKVSWFDGDNYKLIANNNADVELIMSFCLCLDNATEQGKQSSMTWNIGWFGPQVKEFDPTWFPK